MAKIELVFNSNEVKKYLNKNSMQNSYIIQRKLELIQNQSDCSNSKNLIVE